MNFTNSFNGKTKLIRLIASTTVSYLIVVLYFSILTLLLLSQVPGHPLPHLKHRIRLVEITACRLKMNTLAIRVIPATCSSSIVLCPINGRMPPTVLI